MAIVLPEKDDSRPLNGIPVAVIAIITLNVLMFLVELVLGDQFIERFSLKPAEIVQGHQLETLLTSMFMHASLLHIAGNMIFLWVFGNELETNYLGGLRFVIFYLICGFAAEALQIAVDPASTVPNLGASGAIAGVLAGFLVVFPNDQIRTLVVGIFVFTHVRIMALIFIGVWFLIQFVSGVGSIASLSTNQGGTAYFAHIGGFIAGLVLIKLFGIGAGRQPAYSTPLTE